MLPSYFDYIYVHVRQKARLRPDLSPKFLSTLGPNLARTRPEKPGPTYNSDTGKYSRNFTLFLLKLNVKQESCKYQLLYCFVDPTGNRI